MVAPPRRFFSKAGDSAKRFFTKQTADTAKDVFRKTEAVVKQVKKEAPGVIDEALRKTSNTLKEAAPVVGKIGTGIAMASPALAAVPGIGVGLAAGGAALGTGLQKSERGIKKLGGVVGDIRQETTLKRGSGIQAPKPVVEEEPRDPLPFY
jgi:hypothetical protein